MAKNAAFWIACQTGKTPLALGTPGVGKSAQITAFAKACGRQLYVLIGSLRDPADVGGYPYPVEYGTVVESGEKKVYMSLLPPKYAVDAQEGKWILFIDELTTCPPAVQAALLRVIAEKHVGDLALPEDTWIVSAANPAGMAANGHDLEPPMANRLCHLNWEMDWDSWEMGMLNGGEFPEPQFPLLPENWREKIPQVNGMIAAYRRARPTAFEPALDSAGNLKMSRTDACGAWPSARSWTMAGIMLAAAKAVNAPLETQIQLVGGCVGDGVTTEFFKWLQDLDLPDPELILQDADSALKAKKEMKIKLPERPDKLIAVVSSVSAAVMGTKDNPDRWMAAMYFLEAVAKKTPDVAAAAGKSILLEGSKIPGVRIRDALMDAIVTPMRNAGLCKA